MRETTTLVLNTEINVQLGEFTIKKHQIYGLEQVYMDNGDFKVVFKDMPFLEVLQSAEVRNTTNRTWVRLIGRGYDLQYWRPDTRYPKAFYSDTYEYCRYSWVKDLLEPWRRIAFPDIVFYMGSCTDDMAIMQGVSIHPGQSEEELRTSTNVKGTLKEIILYRYPRVFHVYNILEYGRRWYRSLIFSSDSSFSPHDLPVGFVPIGYGIKACCGDPKTLVEPEATLVIIRHVSVTDTHTQHFVPSRLLLGIMLSALLE